MSIQTVQKQDLEAIASFYHVPEPVAKMMFAVIGDTLYPKLQFLLYKAHLKGVQRIEVSQPKETGGEWTTEARIYPLIPASLLTEILRLPEVERKAIWEYFSKPTIEWGRASKDNVSNQTMWKWLPEMSRKRAAARALRLYAGIGQTAYEEMPQASLSREELETEGTGKIITIEPSTSTPAEESCNCGCPSKDHFSADGTTYCVNCVRAKRDIKCSLLVR